MKATLPLLTLLFILLLPGAFAAPRPPQALVGETTSISWDPTIEGAGVAVVNFTYLLSPDDPDQVNGAYNYTIFFNTTFLPSCSYPNGWPPTHDIGPTGVTNRPGWVSNSFAISFGHALECTVRPYWRFNFTATNGSDRSAVSCMLNVTVEVVGSHSQCGSPILTTPTGVSLTVASKPTNATSNLTASWPLSSDDPDQTNGSLEYRMVYDIVGPQFSYINKSFSFGGSYFPIYGNGYGSVTIGWDPYQTTNYIFAVDPLTRQWSNRSCGATVNGANLYESNGCGSMASYSFVPGGVPTASFPGFNLALFAASTGISLTVAGMVVGGMFLAFLVYGGYLVGGKVGSTIAFGGGLAACALMGLFPYWAIIVSFIAATAIVVLLGFNGRGAES